ncbi:glycosyltransferase family 2 protein [Teredinibacter waterburyi]|uniref:glycosyltransferase family 2 protein n=1 Tax=Teredinibacter waterburyi TaxID=1500538 RepID=UPI00165EF6ED|nr:glycosyltransferase family 2 protein [Teredinibacter waterburyi]
MLLSLLYLLAIALTIPALLFVTQCIGAAFSRQHSEAENEQQQNYNLKIIIPAHNEAACLDATLSSLIPQLKSATDIVLVADNCADETADIARAAGCTVLERQHDTERGKGYALAHALAHLADQPPQLVIFVDADCQVQPHSIERLAQASIKLQRPIQGQYLIQAPPNSAISAKISEFAILVKNRVRPLGQNLLKAPVPLVGSGMAFLWDDIAKVSLASGEIVEDMKLGIEFACKGKGAYYLDSALVTSTLPTQAAALKTQRERWEHGHLGLIQRYGLPLLKSTFQQRQLSIALFTLDLIIPPLSLLIAITLLILIIQFLGIFFTQNLMPFFIVVTVFCLLCGSVILSWWKFARHVLSAAEIIHAPLYAVSKLLIYTGFIKKRQTSWIRTERDDNTSNSDTSTNADKDNSNT